MIDHHQVVKAVAVAVAGSVLGWSANALTLNGEVKAIEAALVRIESRLDAITLRESSHDKKENSKKTCYTVREMPGFQRSCAISQKLRTECERAIQKAKVRVFPSANAP